MSDAGARRRRDQGLDRLFFGILILVGGIAFLLDQLDMIDAREVFYWWPLALILGAVFSVIERKYVPAVLLLIFGAVFLLPKVGVPLFGWTDLVALFPLTITFAGVALVLQAIRPTPKDVFGERPAGFRAAALMAGNSRTIASPAFLGGDAFAVMGGCEIDLRDARIQGDEAVIDVLAFWGGIDIRVPREWKVVSQVSALIGGYADYTDGGVEGGPRLVLRGAAIMAGVEVRCDDRG